MDLTQSKSHAGDDDDEDRREAERKRDLRERLKDRMDVPPSSTQNYSSSSSSSSSEEEFDQDGVEMFKEFDVDGSGEISIEEFMAGMKKRKEKKKREKKLKKKEKKEAKRAAKKLAKEAEILGGVEEPGVEIEEVVSVEACVEDFSAPEISMGYFSEEISVVQTSMEESMIQMSMEESSAQTTSEVSTAQTSIESTAEMSIEASRSQRSIEVTMSQTYPMEESTVEPQRTSNETITDHINQIVEDFLLHEEQIEAIESSCAGRGKEKGISDILYGNQICSGDFVWRVEDRHVTVIYGNDSIVLEANSLLPNLGAKEPRGLFRTSAPIDATQFSLMVFGRYVGKGKTNAVKQLKCFFTQNKK